MTTFTERRQRVTDTSGILLFLEISAPSLPNPLRIVNDTQDWTSKGVVYLGAPFDFKLPNDTKGQTPRAQLVVDNVGRGISEDLESIGPNEVLMARLMVSDRADPNTIERDYQFTDARLKAVAESLKEFPELNARLDGDEIVYLDRYDIGVAVQTEQGLVVPVVRGCGEASPDDLAQEVERLADAARAGTLKPEELRGSTFTVTSAGKLAGLFQTPLVNHPEVAILSVGRIAERPVVRDGEVMTAPIGYVSVTFDHRVVDGARAAQFGLDVIRRLEAGS